MRHGFILLEVFVALALISLAVIPITSYPLHIYKKELENLRKIELERIYDVAMVDFLRRLMSDMVWDRIEGEHELGEYAIKLDRAPVVAKVVVGVEEEVGNYRLLRCNLSLGGEEREYYFLVHKSGTNS